MTVGTSLLVFAIGAVLKFAVTAHTSGFNIQEAGVILMIIGVVGFVASLLYLALWHDAATRRRQSAVADDPAADPTRRQTLYR